MADLAEHQERIARALSDWSNDDRPWETRHPKNQQHWMLVAEALMSNDESIVDPINAYVRDRKYPHCELAPEGWWCSRAVGHDGPCAARRLPAPLTEEEVRDA